MTPAGIKTFYAGTWFRSRLEARWAFLFDSLGLKWEYEPFDANGYIPDFLLHGNSPLLIEVKPDPNIATLRHRTDQLDQALDGRWQHDVLIVGVSPMLPELDWWDTYYGVAGLLGEYSQWEPDDWSWAWDRGLWHTCLACDTFGVYHEILSFKGRPCGHYDGDGYLGSAPTQLIHDAWAEARNATRWTP